MNQVAVESVFEERRHTVLVWLLTHGARVYLPCMLCDPAFRAGDTRRRLYFKDWTVLTLDVFGRLWTFRKAIAFGAAKPYMPLRSLRRSRSVPR